MGTELRSIVGFPKRFESSTPYPHTDFELEDGDLLLREGDFARIDGITALGQYILTSLCYLTEDLFAPQESPRIPFPDEQLPDMRGIPLEERIRIALAKREITDYVDAILDVRTNGFDVEIDFEPAQGETHVLRIDGLVARPGEARGRLGHRRAIPVEVRGLLTIEDLSHRLIAHLQGHPQLLHELHPRAFERLVAQLLDDLGWDVLELTRATKDGGVDIFAALPKAEGGSCLAVIDCKRWREPLGVDAVRTIAGLKLQHRADFGMLVATSYFTKGARDLERGDLHEHVKLEDVDAVTGWLQRHRWRRDGSLYLPTPRFAVR